MSFRLLVASDQTSNIPIVMTARREAYPISINSEFSPQLVSESTEYVFSADGRSGDLWLKVALDSGMFLEVETAEADPGGYVDTYISLLEQDSMLEIKHDDDSGRDNYSKLSYEAFERIDVLVKVSRCCPAGEPASKFDEGDRFNLRVFIANQRDFEVVDAGELENAATIEAGQLTLVRTDAGRRWLRFSVADWGVYRVVRHEPASIFRDWVRFETEITDLNSEQRIPHVWFSRPAGDRQSSYNEFGIPLEAGNDYLLEILDGDSDFVVFSIEAVDLELEDLTASPEAAKQSFRHSEPKLFRTLTGEAEFIIEFSENTTHSLYIPKYSVEEVEVELLEIVGDVRTSTEVDVVVYDHWTSVKWEAAMGASYIVRIKSNEPHEPIIVASGLSVDIPFNGLKEGDFVVLGRHTEWAGSSNWSDSMEKYVGCKAEVTELVGTDPSESYIVRVDLIYPEEENDWVWRTRNMVKAGLDTTTLERCVQYTPH